MWHWPSCWAALLSTRPQPRPRTIMDLLLPLPPPSSPTPATWVYLILRRTTTVGRRQASARALWTPMGWTLRRAKSTMKTLPCWASAPTPVAASASSTATATPFLVTGDCCRCTRGAVLPPSASRTSAALSFSLAFAKLLSQVISTFHFTMRAVIKESVIRC